MTLTMASTMPACSDDSASRVDGGVPGGDGGGNGSDGGSASDAPDAGPCEGALVEGKSTLVPPDVARPALNVPYVNPYGLSVARVTDGSQVGDADWVRHEYSRRPAFNADGTKAFMISSNGAGRLYTVNPTGTLDYVGVTDPSEPNEPNWHPSDPNKMYYFADYGRELKIFSYDTATGESTVAADLTSRVQAIFPTATGMWTKQEGRPSNDGKIWCMEVGHITQPGSDFALDGLISYNLETDTILGHLATTTKPDHISTSPKGTYCVPSWGLGEGGTRAYKTDFSAYTQLHDRSQHSDTALTKDGEEVLVYSSYGGEGDGNVVMVNMDSGVKTLMFEVYGNNHSFTSVHISGTSRDKPGYIVASFYGCREDYGNLPCDPSTQWFSEKVVAVEVAANPKIYTLAHTHYGDAGYFSETQAVASRDLSKVLFASTWRSTSESDISSYLVQVPACALP